MTNIQFRKPSELPENPPDGMRIVAKIDQRMLAIQYTHSDLWWIPYTYTHMRTTEITAWIPESELLKAAEEVE